MPRYAIEIQEEDLALVARLNWGVTPAIEANTTYLVFDTAVDSNVPNEIVTLEELIQRDEFAYTPTILLLT